MCAAVADRIGPQLERLYLEDRSGTRSVRPSLAVSVFV
jgi:hypothetical protein